MPSRGRQAQPLRGFHHHELVPGIVDAEGVGGYDTLAPRLSSSSMDRRASSGFNLRVFKKGVAGFEKTAGHQRNIADEGLISWPACPRYRRFPSRWMPTGARSPSSSAFVAWVVLWARKTTSRGSI